MSLATLTPRRCADCGEPIDPTRAVWSHVCASCDVGPPAPPPALTLAQVKTHKRKITVCGRPQRIKERP